MGRDSTEVRMRRGSEFQPRRARAGSTVGRSDGRASTTGATRASIDRAVARGERTTEVDE